MNYERRGDVSGNSHAATRMGSMAREVEVKRRIWRETRRFQISDTGKREKTMV